MKDLTEAQLIEMERLADSLLNTLDIDSSELSRYGLTDRWEGACCIAGMVARDVAELCAHIRAKASA